MTFTAAATLTNTGTFTIDGTAVVNSGITVTAANLTLDNALQGPGSMVVNGPATLAPGASIGGYNASGTGVHLTLEGATTATGEVNLFEGSELENKGSSATLTLHDSAELYDYDGNGNEVLNDAGATITTATNASNTEINAPAVNNGTVSVKSGTLSYGSGTAPASESGTFSAATGATLNIAGTQTEASGINYAGAGTIDVTGQVTFTAAATLTNTGTFEIDGTATFTAAVTLSSTASVDIQGTAVVGSGITVTTDSLTLTGTVEGPGSMVVTGPASLGGSAGIGGYDSPGTGVRLTLEGATLISGQVDLFDGSELENKGTSAVLTLQDGANLADYDGDGNAVVNDAGATITTATDANDTYVSAPAVNNGTVSVKSGTLSFGTGTAPASDSGTFTAVSGTTLNIAGTQTEASGINYAGAGTIDVTGQVTFTAAATLTNTGTFEIDGPAIVNSGITVTADNLTLDNALEGPGTLVVNGPATLAGGASVGGYNASGTGVHLTLEGATTINGQTDLFEGSELENKGTSAILTLQDGANLADYDGDGNEVLNDAGATITTATDANNTYVNAPLTNSGVLSATSGTLDVSSLTNLTAAGTLTGGSYLATGGTLELPNAIVRNAASITLGTSPSSIDDDGNDLASLATNSGSLDLKQSVMLNGPLTNSGTLIEEGSTTLQTTTFTQSAGTTTLNGGTTLDATGGGVAINGGTLTGTGKVTGNLQGAGTIVPIGNTSTPLTVSGTYKPASAGTLSIAVSGATHPGTDFGQLSVGGAAALNGALQLVTASGYSPPIGTAYTILKAASVTGTFSSVTGTQLSDRQYLISYTSTSVIATVQPLPPTVSGVSPTAGPIAGGNTVTLTGTNFVSGATVKFGSVAGTSVSVVSPTEITVNAPAQSSAGPVDVIVTTPGGTSTTSSADRYTYDPVPTVTGVSPAVGPTSGGTTVTIAGTGFVPGATVLFGTASASSVTYVSATQLTAKAPAQAAGTHNVYVTTPGGTSATNAPADDYSYEATPTVTAVSPSAGPTAGGTSVTITGTGFVTGATVKFGTIAGTSVTVSSSTKITVTAPAQSPSSPVDVTVTTPGGTSATSTADQYAYDPVPTVSSLSPDGGPTSGGTTVTITGTGFVTGSHREIRRYGGDLGQRGLVNLPDRAGPRRQRRNHLGLGDDARRDQRQHQRQPVCVRPPNRHRRQPGGRPHCGWDHRDDHRHRLPAGQHGQVRNRLAQFSHVCVLHTADGQGARPGGRDPQRDRDHRGRVQRHLVGR